MQDKVKAFSQVLREAANKDIHLQPRETRQQPLGLESCYCGNSHHDLYGVDLGRLLLLSTYNKQQWSIHVTNGCGVGLGVSDMTLGPPIDVLPCSKRSRQTGWNHWVFEWLYGNNVPREQYTMCHIKDMIAQIGSAGLRWIVLVNELTKGFFPKTELSWCGPGTHAESPITALDLARIGL
eukprot:286622-Amphidinium_carterae.1